MGVTCGDWCAWVIPGSALFLLTAIALLYWFCGSKRNPPAAGPPGASPRREKAMPLNMPPDMYRPLNTPQTPQTPPPRSRFPGAQQTVVDANQYIAEDFVLLKFEGADRDDYGRLVEIGDPLLLLRVEPGGELRKVMSMQVDFVAPSNAVYDARFILDTPPEIPDPNAPVKIVGVDESGNLMIVLPDYPQHGAFHVHPGLLQLGRAPNLTEPLPSLRWSAGQGMSPAAASYRVDASPMVVTSVPAGQSYRAASQQQQQQRIATREVVTHTYTTAETP